MVCTITFGVCGDVFTGTCCHVSFDLRLDTGKSSIFVKVFDTIKRDEMCVCQSSKCGTTVTQDKVSSHSAVRCRSTVREVVCAMVVCTNLRAKSVDLNHVTSKHRATPGERCVRWAYNTSGPK